MTVIDWQVASMVVWVVCLALFVWRTSRRHVHWRPPLVDRTDWTGAWTLTLRHSGVSADGTFRYLWTQKTLASSPEGTL